MTDDNAEQQLREQEFLGRLIRQRLERAERAYNHAPTALWVANGSAALAVVGLIGATWPKTISSELVSPLAIFLVGLIFMGLGTVASLHNEGRVLREMEHASSFWNTKPKHYPFPSERVKLNVVWYIAFLAFVVGCLSGIGILS